MAITITIGRNVDGVPMDDSRWLDFQDALEDVVWRVYAPDVYFKGEGSGTSERWGGEDAFTIVAEAPGQALGELEAELTHVRRLYGQEAVAVTIGETRFV